MRHRNHYNRMTREQLLHEFCSRVPDLYHEMLAIANGLDRKTVIDLLCSIDRDRREGRRGRIFRPPFTPED